MIKASKSSTGQASSGGQTLTTGKIVGMLGVGAVAVALLPGMAKSVVRYIKIATM